MKKVHVIRVGGIATNCWIYPLDDGTGRCAVIDPGEEGGRIIAFLDQLKLIPAYILLTHGHFDHIGAIAALAREYQGRNAAPQIAIHAGDAQYLGPGSLDAHRKSFIAVGGDPIYIAGLEEPPPPDRILAEGDSIGPFTVLHLPGHSPGSIALWDREEGHLFSGDTLFAGGYGRTDLPGGNEAELFASLKRLFAMDPGIQVYPGHGPATSMGREAY